MSTLQGSYREKKAFLDQVLTIYGRKPALEALRDPALECHALHLADSNRSGGIIAELQQLAQQRRVPVHRHSREALARISHNGRQDQGVALDIVCPRFRSLDDYLADITGQDAQRLLALDGITNPQNLGMIIRSAAAGQIDGILWPRKGNAAPGPLVLKASAGTLYRAPVLLCTSLPEALSRCRAHGMEICTLAAGATQSLFDYCPLGHSIFVLGNETSGVTDEVAGLADRALSIPMNNAVESLNVAVTASLIAFAGHLAR